MTNIMNNEYVGFMRFYTRKDTAWLKISCDIATLHSNFNISWFQIIKLLHQNQNNPWLHISWDTTPEQKCLLVLDFMRYCTLTSIYHGCRFREILHQNKNILWLKISWENTFQPQYLIVANFMRYHIKTNISQGFRYYEI